MLSSPEGLRGLFLAWIAYSAQVWLNQAYTKFPSFSTCLSIRHQHLEQSGDRAGSGDGVHLLAAQTLAAKGLNGLPLVTIVLRLPWAPLDLFYN